MLNIEKLKEHPVGFAVTIAVTTTTIIGTVLYSVYIMSLRSDKAELISELQLTKQRVSSLEATLATHEGQCTLQLQALNKELIDRCNGQLSTTAESAKQLASTTEKLIVEAQHKDQALLAASAQLNNQQTVRAQLQQLRMDEKNVVNQIANLHTKHNELSQKYGYNKVECEEKSGNFYGFAGNICEHASMNKSELESIEREIESAKLRLSQVQQQIIQLQSSVK